MPIGFTGKLHVGLNWVAGVDLEGMFGACLIKVLQRYCDVGAASCLSA